MCISHFLRWLCKRWTDMRIYLWSQWPLLLTWFNVNPSMDEYHMLGKVQDEISYPFPNFNGCIDKVWEWINNFIPHIIIGVISLSMPELKLIYVSKKGPGRHSQSPAMMTSSNGNIFRVTGHLCGKFTGPRWISRTKASDAELWCFLWFNPE